MKRLLIALLLMLAAPAWAEEPVQLARMNPAVLGAGVSAAETPITLGTSTSCRSAYNGTTCGLTKDLVAGNLVVLWVSVYDTSELSVSDNADPQNTYTALTQNKRTGGVVGQLFYSVITTAKAGATITVSGGVTGGYTSMLAANFTGSWPASPSDKDVSARGYSMTPSVTSLALSQAKELLVVGLQANSGPLTSDETFSLAAQDPSVNQFRMDYRIVSSADSITYTGSYESDKSWIANLGSFKAN